ncbi:DUF5960 family protein [Streptococcus ictaluri]|uniref:Uncharacterized protein n=1 Tax=Streptococcus ictaluri 707-05 TaxID=764299 RepID=G5K3B1_9STRE|nr:DUF5960 family protein [Streptococcus ictaluri]EHI69812.1 hypothetical protein STRIC_1279 [Streptococcus ictaluri 707-05]
MLYRKVLPFHFNQNNYQIDFFSPSYRAFENDFYKYSTLEIPLTFLIDDILLAMVTSKKNYFKLSKEKSSDQQDHYFFFERTALPENPFVYLYHYLGAALTKESF